MYHSFSSQMLSGTLSCFHSDFSHRHTPILAAFITHMVPLSFDHNRIFKHFSDHIHNSISESFKSKKNMSHIHDPVSLKKTGFSFPSPNSAAHRHLSFPHGMLQDCPKGDPLLGRHQKDSCNVPLSMCTAGYPDSSAGGHMPVCSATKPCPSL